MLPIQTKSTYRLSAAYPNQIYLQVVGVRSEDQGRYDCYADNGRGPPVSAVIVLSVNQPRELAANIIETDPDVIMSLGAPATLYCLAYGWPKPTVTWWKGTKILPLNSDRLSQDDFTLRHLRINGLNLVMIDSDNNTKHVIFIY